MPTRIENILTRARLTLADPDKERYSDSRLLSLLSDGLQDINTKAKLLRSRVTLIPTEYKSEYILPEDVWIITRVTSKGNIIPLITYDELDDSDLIYGDWQTKKSARLLSVIYDRMNQGQIRLYPIPTRTDIENNYNNANNFGVVTSISSGTMSSYFGISMVPQTDDTEPVYDSVFGEIISLEEQLPAIEIQYFALAPVLSSVTEQLPISYSYDRALKHYVVGHALRDDLDTQSRSLGAEELALYQVEVNLARRNSSINTTRSTREIKYTGPFSYDNC